MKHILTILFLILSLTGFGQISNLEVKNIYIKDKIATPVRIAYSGDTARIYFQGDSVIFYTDKSWYYFNKPIQASLYRQGADTLTTIKALRDSVIMLLDSIADLRAGLNNISGSSDSTFDEVDVTQELRIGDQSQLNNYIWSFRNFAGTSGFDFDSLGIKQYYNGNVILSTNTNGEITTTNNGESLIISQERIYKSLSSGSASTYYYANDETHGAAVINFIDGVTGNCYSLTDSGRFIVASDFNSTDPNNRFQINADGTNEQWHSGIKKIWTDTTGTIQTKGGLVTEDSIKPGGRLLIPMGEISYFNTTGTTITISGTSDGSSNMVVVNPTTTFSNDMDFDNGGSNNGRLRYTGTTTRTFHIACSISFTGATTNQDGIFGIAKNGTVISASKVISFLGLTTDTRSTALHVMVMLATNDYLELYVGNMTATNNVVVKTLNLFAMGM